MIINRKRQVTINWLLPGWKLDEPLGKSAGALSGELFEALTATILQGERGTLDSTKEICPDLIDEGNKVAIESKGSNKRSGVKIHEDQLVRYERLASEGWQVLYCLWLYGAEGLAKQFKTIGECVVGIVDSIELLTIMDVRMIRALVDSDLKGIQYYAEWSHKWARIRGYAMPLWVIRPTVFRGLLSEELALDPTLFDRFIRERRPKRKTRVTYNGKEFATSTFDLLVYEHTDDIAPF